MDKKILNLLRKYLDNRCTADELEQVRAILRSNNYDKEWVAVLQEDAERSINGDAAGVLEEDRAGRLLERITTSAGIHQSKIHRSFFKTLLFAAAASILIMITAGIAFFMTSSVFDTGDDLKAVTISGEQTELLLADGTRVLLKDQSMLSYPDEFNGGTRTVHLQGRAFFDVASDPSQPFLVQTDELTIRVTGTSFDVSAYTKDQDVAVSVASGSVRVTGPSVSRISDESELHPNDKSVNTLMPGDQLTYDKLNNRYHQQTMTPDDIRSLSGAKLIFQNQTLGDIARALERRYEVRFHFEEETTPEQRLTFKPNSSNLDEVLKVLSLVTGLDYKMSGNEVLMSEK